MVKNVCLVGNGDGDRDKEKKVKARGHRCLNKCSKQRLYILDANIFVGDLTQIALESEKEERGDQMVLPPLLSKTFIKACHGSHYALSGVEDKILTHLGTPNVFISLASFRGKYIFYHINKQTILIDGGTIQNLDMVLQSYKTQSHRWTKSCTRELHLVKLLPLGLFGCLAVL